MQIPFSPPDISEKEIEEVIDSLKSGWITTGPKTKELEKRIAEYSGTSKAVCLNSATAALELTLRILGIGPGDEVIVPAYTYTATASVVDHVGAKIVMVDSIGDSIGDDRVEGFTGSPYEMDPGKLEASITERTKAIIPVDLGGRICDYNSIFAVIEKKLDLFRPRTDIQKIFGRPIVVADSAHGFGAGRKSVGSGDMLRSGNFADFTCFSFHAVKNFTTAEGGAVTWLERKDIDSENLYREYMLASLHGQTKDALAKTKVGAWEYDIVYPAYKCNMTDVHAAIGLAQMDRYPAMLQRRKEIIEKYDEAFLAEGLMPLNHFDDINESSGHLYLLRIPGVSVAKRNSLIEKMGEKGVATNVHYKPLPMLTAYKNLGFDIEKYPGAYGMYENEITLPLWSRMTDEEVQYIIETFLTSLEEVIGK